MNDSTYALLFASALGAIRRDGTNVDPRVVAENLRSSNPAFADMPLTQFRQIFDRAYATNAQAGTMNDNTTQTEAARAYPIDPTIPIGAEQFAYRVVVYWDDGRGNKGETLVIVRSDRPLNGEEVYAYAINDVREGVQESTSGKKSGGQGADYHAHIVSGGRSRHI